MNLENLYKIYLYVTNPNLIILIGSLNFNFLDLWLKMPDVNRKWKRKSESKQSETTENR